LKVPIVCASPTPRTAGPPVLHLTTEGEAAVAAYPGHVAAVARAFEILADADQRELLRMLDTLSRHLERLQAAPDPP
jgi:hypothetical protein